MKKIIILSLMVLLSVCGTDAQHRGKQFRGPMDKIEELEKLKLIEALNLDEETTIRFIARHNEHKDRMEALRDSTDVVLDRMDDAIRGNKTGNDAVYKKLLNKFLELDKQTVAERERFLKSLDDILSPEEVAKIIVFESKFREEMRRLLLKRRGMPDR